MRDSIRMSRGRDRLARCGAAPPQLAMFSARAAADGEQVELRDGGWIRYWPAFLPQTLADRLFAALRRAERRR